MLISDFIYLFTNISESKARIIKSYSKALSFRVNEYCKYLLYLCVYVYIFGLYLCILPDSNERNHMNILKSDEVSLGASK